MQVSLMGKTDILISPHGAQLTNMFLMDRNSSVLEFFPKGWLKLAGIGQFVYHWMASWSGMKHQGAWRDPNGLPCPYSDNDRRCMSIYKAGSIGYVPTTYVYTSISSLNFYSFFCMLVSIYIFTVKNFILERRKGLVLIIFKRYKDYSYVLKHVSLKIEVRTFIIFQFKIWCLFGFTNLGLNLIKFRPNTHLSLIRSNTKMCIQSNIEI